ncbi:ethanolamine ammonia-lyase subunit EutC [Aneurinibacillus thermoaerophilus]|uniref:Ethanolamine ammonia-lyase small subunit n=1 Tax=Aneurinibacillus thermoaerophilus TaxID=143495 RepID=A0A1G7X6K1_ANETH|nr:MULTISPECIES: ethanolamine ammonia-lyase subunit EutC [Aneurinibacillus]AMA73226.1 ethanolamine ammonia-lyase [Aneurinibacillus sp. XH2]MED0674347.1 ethanolamine ammonia-lyase subunit EutC [Aneurinibacillus thermoaerophilus]MED0678365.1 ethanolamine ammonia-lyase subunit EutC [Aneurinibacillus thermoaerophilus]MED0756954.1 ethanolamine ammonia-lyase subunit EutC [Aneurinibacillus thermoaerophilus]MED0761741.1 ethanolamine ammonia-lyase subunit EutC [Aneurinibacillus thermoaerophilus]
MDQQLIETVTRLVMEKLKAVEAQQPLKEPKLKAETRSYGSVKVWDHVASGREKITENPVTPVTESTARQTKPVEPSATGANGGRKTGIEKPQNKEQLLTLMKQTPARIGIGRAGLRPKTDTWLTFRLDHAAAVDAVYGTVNPELLKRLNLFSVATCVSSKEEYILRPDLGRRLSEEAKKTLRERCKYKPKVQIVLSDGLSSQAVDTNAEDTYLALMQSLKNLGIETGTPFFVEKGRVAVMDDIGEVLEPDVVVLLIGERPGLVSAESLSAYLCYRPRKGTVEADRMVISNIHAGGIPPVEAGAYLGNVVQKILKYEASGVSLVQKEK